MLHRLSRLLAATVLLCLALGAPVWAGSTIDPTQPAAGAALSSSAMRGNFQAAKNDIDGLEGMFHGLTPPSSPSPYQLWANTSVSPTAINIFDGANWIALGSLDTTGHIWTPVVAGGGIATPGGRLTIVSHTPVLFSPGENVDSQTYVSSTIYYDCYVGKQVPRYNGAIDVVDTISGCEVGDTMPTSGVGVTNSAGVFDEWWTASGICHATNGAGGGWASDTATDASRTGNTNTSKSVTNLSTNVVAAGWWPGMTITDSAGDIPGGTTIFSIGADGTSLTLSQAATGSHAGDTLTVTGATNQMRGFGYSAVHNTRGYWTNVTAIAHCYNGATDYGSIAADKATYLGTLYTTGAGQTTVNFQTSASGGIVGIIGYWNAYNRQIGETAQADTKTSWTVTSSTPALLDGSANNRLEWVDGLQLSTVTAAANCFANNSGSSSVRIIEAIDWISGAPVGNSAGGSAPDGVYQVLNYHVPRLGFHYIQIMQSNASGAGTATIFGGISCGGGIVLPM
jgi:hypothetical protein